MELNREHFCAIMVYNFRRGLTIVNLKQGSLLTCDYVCKQNYDI